jgi:predicted GTPase
MIFISFILFVTTLGPGLGESAEIEDKYIDLWVNEIPKHDLLYWVLDGSSRDIEHIQRNMKKILDKTNYRQKIVVVLNKVDQILLSVEDETAGKIGWDADYNVPSDDLENLIIERMNDIIEKLSSYAELDKNQIVYCSARKRWNHGKVYDKFIDYLPPEKRLKLSKNRDIKNPVDLMSPSAKEEILNDLQQPQPKE